MPVPEKKIKRNEYDVGIDIFSYPESYSGCRKIEGSSCMVIFTEGYFWYFHQNFTSFDSHDILLDVNHVLWVRSN